MKIENLFDFRFQNPTDIAAKVKHTNILYGGFKPDVTNVYFTHGSIDPWHHMGILQDLNFYSSATVISGLNSKYINFYSNRIIETVFFSGISHCRDLGSISYEKDPKPLINSKVTIRNLVKKWLKL